MTVTAMWSAIVIRYCNIEIFSLTAGDRPAVNFLSKKGRNKMKKLLAALLCIMMILSFAACGAKTDEEDNVFTVGMECNYAPYNWTQTEETDRSVPIKDGVGYADGYDVQIAKMIAEGLGMELEIVKIEWDGLTLALQNGDIDAIIAGMSPTAERKETIDFTAPYYESELVVVVRKDGKYANATTLAELDGAVITGQLNTFHYTVIDQIPNVVKETAMETFPAMIVALTSGKIDGYVSEKPGAVSAMEANADLTYVEFSEGNGFEASEEDVAISVGIVKNSPLKADIDAILATIDADTRQQIMDDAVANQPLSE